MIAFQRCTKCLATSRAAAPCSITPRSCQGMRGVEFRSTRSDTSTIQFKNNIRRQKNIGTYAWNATIQSFRKRLLYRLLIHFEHVYCVSFIHSFRTRLLNGSFIYFGYVYCIVHTFILTTEIVLFSSISIHKFYYKIQFKLIFTEQKKNKNFVENIYSIISSIISKFSYTSTSLRSDKV